MWGEHPVTAATPGDAEIPEGLVLPVACSHTGMATAAPASLAQRPMDKTLH